MRRNSVNSASGITPALTVVFNDDNFVSKTTIVAIWQHYKWFFWYAQKRLFRNFQSIIWPRHLLRRPRFPIRQMYFHYRVTFTDIFDVFVLLRRMTLWPSPLTFWPCVSCAVLLMSNPHTNFYYPTTIGYEYWIFDHISVIWYSYCACSVSRDLCIGGPPKTTRNNFLTPNCLFNIQLLWGYDDD